MNKKFSAVAVLALSTIVISGCGAGNGTDKAASDKSGSDQKADKTVTLIAYDSFPTRTFSPRLKRRLATS